VDVARWGEKRLPANLTRKTRVIIADDSPEMLHAVEQRLSNFCRIIAKAANGIELIDRVGKLHPDIVITDISMPHMTGLEALRQLRAQGSTIPAVLVTVHEDEELVRAGLEQGALGFILKSRLDSDLVPAVRAALKGQIFVSERLRKKIL
jgi:DNA-binding NarL/FixJ family response regulator